MSNYEDLVKVIVEKRRAIRADYDYCKHNDRLTPNRAMSFEGSLGVLDDLLEVVESWEKLENPL
jgi:hypothetical protein